MPRRTFTPTERAAVAQAWAEARGRGEKQGAFAARVGIDARRIRQFAREAGIGDVPVEAVRRIVSETVEKLQHLLVQLAQPARLPAQDGYTVANVSNSGAPSGEGRIRWDLGE
jgi:hypothetical protein